MRNSYYKSTESIDSMSKYYTTEEQRQKWEIRPNMETVKHLYQSSCEKK